LLAIRPEPEHAPSVWALLLKPKAQGLADRLGPLQTVLQALRVERRTISVWQIDDRAHR